VQAMISEANNSLSQQSTEAPIARVRSLSVGNEHKWRNARVNESLQQQAPMEKATQEDDFPAKEECHLNNSNSNLRRHELIEIIKESMEKNRLCFQGNK